jgi:hypothetical protein
MPIKTAKEFFYKYLYLSDPIFFIKAFFILYVVLIVFIFYWACCELGNLIEILKK